ncbi:MAG: sigma factor [Erythrobacter sp.]
MRPDTISINALRIAALARQVRDTRVHPRTCTRLDRAFTDMLEALRPRIIRLIAQYALTDMREDAEQAAAIGVHRALQTFDPAQASFATHATWQIRGELQSLRHRMRLDQRRSAMSAGLTTVSLEALSAAGEPLGLSDTAALEATESAASDAMAQRLAERLLDRAHASGDERAIMFEYLFDGSRRDGGRRGHRKRLHDQSGPQISAGQIM